MPPLVLLAAVALAVPGSGSPAARTAAVCAQYPNQAAAQKAHDTLDADHDGIFCEALPCPCSTTSAPQAPAKRTPVASLLHLVGRSIALHRVTRAHGCRVHGSLPDRRCTPGARFSRASRARICRSGYARAVRHVSAATRRAVYAAYGMHRRFDGHDGELDHLVSLELGGSNARANLFPEAAPGSRRKDRLENALHRDVCAGRISLRHAQRLIATDWVAAYRARLR